MQANIKAYELGKDLSKNYDDIRNALADDRVTDLIGWDFYGVEALFIKAGFNNADMPVKVKGWRYGDIPEAKRSWNALKQAYEDGVSMAEVELPNGDIIKTADEFSLMFIKTSVDKIVECEGWLNTFKKGGDGEPLIII